MKLWDRIKLSIKTLRGRWTVLPIIAVVLASFCICYAGAIFTAVKEEKEQPHELVLTPDSNVPVTDSSIIEISDLQGVVAVSPLYFIPVVMETGVYSAQLTLTGIDSNYIAEPFIEGTIYPESSTMPYVVLNEASLMEFSDANSNTSGNKKAPDIDWLNAGFSIEIPGIRKIVSKVCGILSFDATSKGEDRTGNMKNIESSQHPNAYISLSTAKDLLQRSGLSTEYSAAYVRVTNIGQADKISREVASLGLFTSNSSEELQTRWDALTREMYYLIIMAVFFLLGSITLMSTWRKLSLMEESQSWNMLLWMGLKQRSFRQVFSLQGFMISIAGWAIGSIIAKVLPSFLSPETETITTSIFTLQIPLEAIVVSFLLCIVMGQVFVVRRWLY